MFPPVAALRISIIYVDETFFSRFSPFDLFVCFAQIS